MNESKSKIDISFRAFSANSCFEDVRTSVRCLPTKVFHSGEERSRLKSGKILHYKESGFFIVRIESIEEDISLLIENMLDDIGLNIQTVANLRSFGFRLDFFVGIFNAPTGWGFNLEEKIIRKLSDINIPISFSIYS
jgi:hypothetical protein